MGKIEYDYMLGLMDTNPIAHKVIIKNYGKPLEVIDELITEAVKLNTSRSIFPGDLTIMYPVVKTRRSTKLTSTILGQVIEKGEAYLDYRALLLNYTSKEKYVINPDLKFYLNDGTPNNIFELEEIDFLANNNIGLQRVEEKGLYR